MLCLSTDIKWNVRSLAVAFYAYILHTRIDNEIGDIVFAYYDHEALKRIVIEVEEHYTFFDMLANSRIIDFSIDEMSESSMSAVITNESNVSVDLRRFNICIRRESRELRVDFYEGFSFAQQQNFSKFYLRIVKYSLEHGECQLNNYSMLREDEIYPIKHAFDNTSVSYNHTRLVLDDFYSHLLKNPNRTCIVYKDEEYSFSAIELQSNRIANLLHKGNLSLARGAIIYMGRSEKILSSILGIMKCAGYYLPVDISTPLERLKNIALDSKAAIILVDNDDIVDVITQMGLDAICVNVNSSDSENDYLDFERVLPGQNDPCYMIYTSGTTGKPKGVMITNRNIANFVSNNILTETVIAKKVETPCIIAPNKVGFDAFVGDMLLSISSGFKIVMASEEELDNPHLFFLSIKRNRVNIIQTTPTRLAVSLLSYHPEILSRFKVIACGGEPLIEEMINKIKDFARDSVLINVYGPTESTVWSAAANITKGDKGIGVPAQNTRCYVLNRYQKFLPNYETGILYIAGDGLGRYCFDPDNQREKFIIVNGIDEEIYNSGDTAYLNSDNYIIYGARADSQVKINGVRIELGEIESVAIKYSHIKECAVAVKEIPGIGRRLVLYYTSDVRINSGEFKTILSSLPDAYIPNYYVQLERLPVTSSNKVDRKSLPVPETNDDEELVLPQTDFEKVLYAAVHHVLQESHVEFAVSVTRPIADYGITSRQTSAILSYLEGQGLTNGNYRKIVNVHMSISEMAKGFETIDNSAITREFPRYSFDKYDDKSLYSCVLLTGASGYLGAHVLENLLKNTKAHIICLYHNSDIKKSYERYNMSIPFDSSRVDCVYGSLSEENLGLLDDDLELAESAEIIINCAAYVKYFGDAERFYMTNVLSVKNLISFAIKNRMVLNHISTLSVLGTGSNNVITEKDLWFEQNEIFENQYIESKFYAENEIMKMREAGLKYRIIRVGRLAWRRDGVFQHNRDDNEFYSTLKLFDTLDMVPSELLNTQIEVSPVDGCADAIVALSNCKKLNGVFHVMNENTVALSKIIESMNSVGCSIKEVPMSEFMEFYNLLSDDNVYKAVTKICCVSNNEFKIEHNDCVTNIITRSILPKRFKWPVVDEAYFGILFGKENC